MEVSKPRGSTGEDKRSSAPLPAAAHLSPVVLRTMTGGCHPTANRGAADWSASCGLLAYASHALVVVADPTTLQHVQVLDKHRAAVCQVRWCRANTPRHPADKMTLASGDAAGNVIVWNVKTGEVKAVLQEGSKPVQAMEWMDGRVDGTGHLLAALHPPFAFVLWDTSNGTKVCMCRQLCVRVYAAQFFLF